MKQRAIDRIFRKGGKYHKFTVNGKLPTYKQFEEFLR